MANARIILIVVTIAVSIMGLSLFGNRFFRDTEHENNGQRYTGGPTIDCPCEELALCNRIIDTTRKEVFVFSLQSQNESWRFYDWSKVTTIVTVGYMGFDVMCYAHKHGARAVIIGSMPKEQLTNKTARENWIESQLHVVNTYFLDGINIDFEDVILENETDIRDAYTALVKETNVAFKNSYPYLQVTVDIAWSPDCIDLRCYDYLGISLVSDFVFVMAYDEQSQILGKCIAKSNSDYSRTKAGLTKFLNMGIAPNKMVLGVPWYGYYYPCLSMSKDNVCSLQLVPFRGVNCSDAAGKEIDYNVIMEMLKNSTTGRLWDAVGLSPYFNYIDPATGIIHQIRYDDPDSLLLKYGLALQYKLRGVGMWQAEALDYLHNTTETIKEWKEMWGAIPRFKVPSNPLIT
ncbi:hypothetical protein CHS0354_008326 [Potamilus streckersoni]|uniref:Di-N-acetylchitobiase n=1 Tax=Potamilus streckersoni TaxID=2493646 RepID=A0AAE0VU50_9BIVA|nr:hypothetical protein CHS0354_008326 [Potamilus streckersoni]